MDFMSELKQLLNKYNAEICWTCDECSDISGIIDGHIEIVSNGETVFSNNCNYIDEQEIE